MGVPGFYSWYFLL